MTTPDSASSSDFSRSERVYIRHAFEQYFSTLPAVADGIPLRTWHSGPQKGEPKLPPPAKALLDRGLVRVDRSDAIPRLFFTAQGIAALRRMMANRRFAHPVRFAHVRRELGIDPGRATKAAE